jgi:hypothetical protein
MFKETKAGPGRPRGSKDRSLIRYKISYWLDKIEAEWADLTANQRANISLELTKILINKSKALPTDPNDSKLNVDEVMLMLRSAEGPPLAMLKQTETNINIGTKVPE